MKKARTELGDDARLVSARRVSAPDQPAVYEVQVLAGAPVGAATSADPEGISALRREIESLRESLTTFRTGGSAGAPASGPSAATGQPGDETPAAPDSRPDPAERGRALLRRRGVSAERAERIASRAAADASAPDPGTALRRALAREFGAPDRLAAAPGETTTLLVGPSGAGKTSVLAKFAAEAARAGRRPTLVAADGESVAGEDTLEAIAAALDLPFETAFLPGRLEELRDRTGAGTALLIDPAGRTPFEPDGLSALRALVEAVPGVEVIPVLPATLDRGEARLLAEAYASLGAERAVITKLDELARPGRIVDFVGDLGLPVTWITFGRGVRGAHAAPGDEPVVSRIVGTTRNLETSA